MATQKSHPGMSGGKLGKTLVIANPAAKSGEGLQGARQVEGWLRDHPDAVAGYEVRLTEKRGHAESVAASAAGFDTVIALGGDGVSHEVVNGLMHIETGARPAYGLIPLGSGNDYARTLGMARNKPLEALEQIVLGTPRMLDLGWVNGIYFDQTLSFGLDAAIALNTMTTRTKNKTSGTRLWMSTGFGVLTREREPFEFRARVWRAPSEGGVESGTAGTGVPEADTPRTSAREARDPEVLDGKVLIFAVQVGPTYGGGFRITPDASPTDGLLNLCRTVRLPSLPHTLALFVRARFGLHTGSPVLEFSEFSRMELEFVGRRPPCQADGEEVLGDSFEIRSVPGALRVITG